MILFSVQRPHILQLPETPQKKCKPDLVCSVSYSLFFLSNAIHLSCFSFSELVMYYYLLEFGEEQIKGSGVVGKLMKWISSITGIQEPGGS